MNLDSLFNPQSIAVIGASRTPFTVGNDVVKNLVTQGYQGNMYPVNPNADELYGLKVYPSVASINDKIDLIVVAIPAPFVAQVVEEAAQKGTKAAIVISAGCKEVGLVELENQIKEVCRKHNIVLVGPNCLGVINPQMKMNASFAAVMPDKGDVAFVSQSGALCTAVLDYARDMGIGFSKFMSIGNKADIDELKLLKFFQDDPTTKVIAMYVEQLENAPEFINTVRALAQGSTPKPVIILKSGKTAAGAHAIASHTGSLSGGDVAYEALFDQSGVIRAHTMAELFDYVQIFSQNKLTPVKRVAILTNAGGPGVLTTDEVVAQDLELAQLSEQTQVKLQEFLPTAANTHNPIDILGDAQADRYEKALSLIVADDNVDGVIVLLTPQSMTQIQETAKAIVRIRHRTVKPIIINFMGRKLVRAGVEILRAADMTTTTFPESAARALSRFGVFAKRCEQLIETAPVYTDLNMLQVKEIFAVAEQKRQTAFPEAEAMRIMNAYGFPTLRSEVAHDVAEAERIGQSIGRAMAMKIVSTKILHKSDVGGVMLDVKPGGVSAAFAQMMDTVHKNVPNALLEGVLMVEMAPKGGIELILGATKQPKLGTTLMVGLGGIYVEVLKDVQLGFVPLSKTDAIRMVENLKSKKLLEGVRGQGPFDVNAVVDNLLRLSQLVIDFPQINELDINPLLVLPNGQGVKLLDARIVIDT